MDRRNFIKKSAISLASVSAVPTTFGDTAKTAKTKISIKNPYAGVDWDKFGQHKANLHSHTIMSDGQQSIGEMAKVYKDAGYSILSISDHDCVIGDKRPEEYLPFDDLDDNYTSYVSWPWPDFGAKSPRKHKLTGIEGCELSSKHHINSFFNGFSVGPNILKERSYDEDEQLNEVARRCGIAFLNHPAIHAHWKQERSLQWYIDRFRKHSENTLVGMEIGNYLSVDYMNFDVSLWDQILAALMPQRPVWGFGNDDAHSINNAKYTYNVFYLDICTEAAIRKAMLNGQFGFCVASRSIDYTKNKIEKDDFPLIKSIKVDEDKQTIAIDADYYDEIKWITAPKSSKQNGSYFDNPQPWDLGTVVGESKTIAYNKPEILKYIRAELIRTDGGVKYTYYTNPFGVV